MRAGMEQRNPVDPARPPITVLHLDDDTQWREQVARILTRENMRVESNLPSADLWNHLGKG
ncbi:MAG: hypothetical protein LUQ13_00200, partial [Methanomicrobiales archaeon]|nr:hypothetical protein [Methanomicrobiales archaeon]